MFIFNMVRDIQCSKYMCHLIIIRKYEFLTFLLSAIILLNHLVILHQAEKLRTNVRDC